MIIVCDIDGTIADNSHRTGFLQSTKKDWNSFYHPELVAQDKPIEAAVRGIKTLLNATGVSEIFFLTGRPESLRKTTEEWLERHLKFKICRADLYMRPDGDYRKASDYKDQALRIIQSATRTGMILIDDDERNSEVYSRWGIFLKAPECWGVIR